LNMRTQWQTFFPPRGQRGRYRSQFSATSMLITLDVNTRGT
jgi:hypothetical protein